MTGTTYKPKYEKIYKSFFNHKFQSLDELNVSVKELEVMAIIQGNNIQIFKYVPLMVFKDDDSEGILEGVWCDYFLDGCQSGTTDIRRYYDHEGCKGFKALNREKSWFIKFGDLIDKDWGKINYYMKVRRVKIKLTDDNKKEV